MQPKQMSSTAITKQKKGDQATSVAAREEAETESKLSARVRQHPPCREVH
jgi:hypothetical protein